MCFLSKVSRFEMLVIGFLYGIRKTSKLFEKVNSYTLLRKRDRDAENENQ